MTAGATEEASAKPPAPAVAGVLGRVPSRPPVELVRWLTGWALLSWLGRTVSWLFGMSRRGAIAIGGESLRLRVEVVFWGRVIREDAEVLPIAAVSGVRRHVRYPVARLAVGAVVFGAGALCASVFLLDGLRSGSGGLVAVASGVLVLGAGLDLLLAIVWPGTRARVAIEVDLAGRARVRLRDVDAGAADSFVGEMSRRLSRQP